MSLLRDAAERLTEELTDEAMTAGLREADLMARDLLDPSDAEEVLAGLELVSQHRGAVVGMTVGAASTALVLMAANSQHAVPAWLSYDERRALQHRSTDDAVRAAEESAKRVEALEQLGIAIGWHLLTRVLPFLLASL